MIDAAISALGLSKGATVGGFFGALVSLKFIEGLSWMQRIPTMFAGMLSAAYVTPLVMEIAAMSPKTEGAVAFLIGVFGMSLAGAFIKAAPEAITGGINALRDRWGRK